MKTYPYTTPDGIIELVRKDELDNALELLREIRDNEVNPQDEADKFLRDHQPSELSKLRADNVELLERLRERTESHLAASARDVQTIQQKSVLLDRLATEIDSITHVIGLTPLAGNREAMQEAFDSARQALAAYESAKSGNLPDPLAEAVKRMERVPIHKLRAAYNERAMVTDVALLLISVAKGERP